MLISSDILNWLMWTGLVPLAVVAIDLLQVTFSLGGSLRTYPILPARPPIQFWIQDFVLLAVGNATGLALFTSNGDPLPAVAGALAGLILFQMIQLELARPLRAMPRAALLIAALAVCLLNCWLALVAAFVAGRVRRGFRFLPATAADSFCRKAAAMTFGVYALAFFLPIRDSGTTLVGYEAYLASLDSVLRKLLQGDPDASWLGLFCWSANVLLWMALYAMLARRWVVSLLSGVAATVGSLFFILFAGPLSGFSPGYYLWVSSMALPVVFSAVALVRHETIPAAVTDEPALFYDKLS